MEIKIEIQISHIMDLDDVIEKVEKIKETHLDDKFDIQIKVGKSANL